MTPQLLIGLGLFLTISSAAAISAIILIERRRAKRQAHINELFHPMAHNWRRKQ